MNKNKFIIKILENYMSIFQLKLKWINWLWAVQVIRKKACFKWDESQWIWNTELLYLIQSCSLTWSDTNLLRMCENVIQKYNKQIQQF